MEWREIKSWRFFLFIIWSPELIQNNDGWSTCLGFVTGSKTEIRTLLADGGTNFFLGPYYLRALGLERIGVDWASSSCINFGSQYSLASLYPNFCVQKFGPVSRKLCWTEELRGTLQTSKTSRILYKIVLQRWLPFSRSGPGPSQAHFLSIQSHSIQSCSNNKRPGPGANTKFDL